jgi:hypothetical protein
MFESASSAASDTSCLGRGSATKTHVRPCFGRLSMVAGTGCARWLWQVVAPCSAEVLPMVATDAGRALGHMLPASARERWPFCVLRDSCHAATADPPRLPPIGSGRRTGGSRRHLRPSYLPLVVTAWLQRVLGRAAWACLLIASQWLERPFLSPRPNRCCVELFVCRCVLAGDVPSAQAGRGAATRYD